MRILKTRIYRFETETFSDRWIRLTQFVVLCKYMNMKKTADELATVKYNVDEVSRKNQHQKQQGKNRSL